MIQFFRDRVVRPRKGTAAIEFGLWLPVMALLFSALVDFSVYMSQLHGVTRAAREGARAGASFYADPQSATGPQVETVASDRAKAVLTGVGMDCPGCVAATYTTAPFERIIVTVTYPYTPLIGMIPLNPAIISDFTMAYEF